jgi:hypothetical protein
MLILSKAVRDLVTRGRVLLAVEKYKKRVKPPWARLRKWPACPWDR